MGTQRRGVRLRGQRLPSTQEALVPAPVLGVGKPNPLEAQRDGGSDRARKGDGRGVAAPSGVELWHLGSAFSWNS